MRIRKLKKPITQKTEVCDHPDLRLSDGYPVSYYRYAKISAVLRRKSGESEGPIPRGKVDAK